MGLTEDQALLWRAISWPTGVADFLARTDDATRAAFGRAFESTDGFDRVARVGVYAEAYYWRLHGVLLDHFGLVAWLLGADRFRNVVTDYVLHRPSNDPDVRRYGARFASFLAGHAEGVRVPGLAELAAIEWAMVMALDAPDERVATVEDLRGVPVDAWPAMRLRAVATARVIACALPFAALWAAHLEAPTPSTAPCAAERAIDVLVWRQGLDVVHRELSADEASAVALVVGGCSFGELCDRVGEAATVVTWLHRWLADDLLAANE